MMKPVPTFAHDAGEDSCMIFAAHTKYVFPVWDCGCIEIVFWAEWQWHDSTYLLRTIAVSSDRPNLYSVRNVPHGGRDCTWCNMWLSNMNNVHSLLLSGCKTWLRLVQRFCS